MTAYRNFSLEFPERVKELDQDFIACAKQRNLEVTYLMMKASSCFLLPFERLAGDSGVSSAEVPNQQKIRKHLNFDEPFARTFYCDGDERWAQGNVDNFSSGPEAWIDKDCWVLPIMGLASCKVLRTLRHSLAHSIFLWWRAADRGCLLRCKAREKESTEKYTVYRCSVNSLNHLLDSWIEKVSSEAVSSEVIWRELDQIA